MLTRTEPPPHSRYMLTRTETPPTKRTNANERKRKPVMTITMLTYMYFYGNTHMRTSCGKKPAKKEAETTLVTTEATQQKKHTTHNLYIFIRCHFGPSLFALVFAPYICPTIQHRCSHLALYFPMVAALPLNCFTR